MQKCATPCCLVLENIFILLHSAIFHLLCFLQISTGGFFIWFISVFEPLSLNAVVAGAEQRAAGAGGEERVQLRPSGRLRLRAAHQRPAQAEEREEHQSAGLRLHVSLQAQRMGEGSAAADHAPPKPGAGPAPSQTSSSLHRCTRTDRQTRCSKILYQILLL